MAGNGEEEIVVKGRKHGQFVLEQLRGGGCTSATISYFMLNDFWEDLVGQLSKPRLEHRSDGINVVKLRFIEKIDVVFGIESSLPMLDVLATARNSIETFLFAAIHIQIAAGQLVQIKKRSDSLTQCISMAARASKTPFCPLKVLDVLQSGSSEFA